MSKYTYFSHKIGEIEDAELPKWFREQPSELIENAKISFEKMRHLNTTPHLEFPLKPFNWFICYKLMPYAVQIKQTNWYWRTMLELMNNAYHNEVALLHVYNAAKWVQKVFDRPEFCDNGALKRLDEDEIFVSKFWTRLSHFNEAPNRAAMREGILHGLDRWPTTDPMMVDWALRLFDDRFFKMPFRLEYTKKEEVRLLAEASIGFVGAAIPTLARRSEVRFVHNLFRLNGLQLFGVWLKMAPTSGASHLVQKPVTPHLFFENSSFSMLLERFPLFALAIFGNPEKLPWEDALHILNGHSLRDLPFFKENRLARLTPKTAYYLQNSVTQMDLTLTQAVVTSKGMSFYENPVLVDLIVRNRNYESLTLRPHFEEVMLFFKKSGDAVHRNAYQQMLDFFTHAFRENRRFSLAGRTAASISRLITAWHTELAHQKIANMQEIKWSPSRIGSFTERLQTGGFYQIKQVLHLGELAEEGANLRHCVLSYAESCKQGYCSIWSLRRIDEHSLERLLTIEIRKNRLVQVRGSLNRMPTEAEKILLQKWCAQERLAINGF